MHKILSESDLASNSLSVISQKELRRSISIRSMSLVNLENGANKNVKLTSHWKQGRTEKTMSVVEKAKLKFFPKSYSLPKKPEKSKCISFLGLCKESTVASKEESEVDLSRGNSQIRDDFFEDDSFEWGQVRQINLKHHIKPFVRKEDSLGALEQQNSKKFRSSLNLSENKLKFTAVQNKPIEMPSSNVVLFSKIL